MSSAVMQFSTQALQVLILDTFGHSDYRDPVTRARVSAQFTLISDPDSLDHELQNRAYDLVLWEISNKANELAALEDFLDNTPAPPPLVVIAAAEIRDSQIEDRLAELAGRGIRDFCFEDEPAVLRRAIGRIVAEQSKPDPHFNAAEFLRTPEALSALVDACPLAVIALTSDGKVSFWNRSAEKIYGWCPEEVMGKPLPTIPVDGGTEFHQLLDSQMHGISYAGKEIQRRRKDGALINVSLWTAPLRDKQGRIVAKLAISADITERRHAEQEFVRVVEREREATERAQSMDRFRELLEAAPDAILEVDAAEGRIVLLNIVTEQLFGYSREELLGQSVDCSSPGPASGTPCRAPEAYAASPTTRPMAAGLDLDG